MHNPNAIYFKQLKYINQTVLKINITQKRHIFLYKISFLRKVHFTRHFLSNGKLPLLC